MLESGGEVGDGGFGVSAAGHGGVEVMSELAQREDSWGELFDVAAEGEAGDSDEVFGESDAGVAVGVFMLQRGSVGALVGAVVGSEGVAELHLRGSAEGLVVRHERGGAADSEYAVGDEHGAVASKVPIQGDGLDGNDNGIKRLPARPEYLRG